MTEHDVIVVGAGPAGITTARELGDQGRSVLVLEGRNRVGGRTYTRPLDGYPEVSIEVGGTYLHPALQHNLRREIQRYDQPIEASVGSVSSAGFRVGGDLRSGLPFPSEELVAVERALVAMARAAERIDPNASLEHQYLADLDVPTGEFFAPLRLPAAAREFIYGVISGVSQADVREVSMLQWLAWIAGLGSPLQMFFGVLDERLKHGTGSLFQAMADDSGADFSFNADVTEIVQDTSQVAVTLSTGVRHTAKLCVVAVGTQVLRRIAFAPELDPAREELLVGTYITRGFKTFVVAENATPGFLGYGGFGGAADPRIGWLYEDQQLPDGRTLLIAWGSGARIDDSLEAAQAAISDYMPQAVVVATDGHDWAGDRFANGINHYRTPGDALRYAKVLGQRMKRVLFATSDLTPTVWNAWIEGAVASGTTAAAEAGALLRGDLHAV